MTCDLCPSSNAYDFARVCCVVRWWKKESAMRGARQANSVLRYVFRGSPEAFKQQVREGLA